MKKKISVAFIVVLLFICNLLCVLLPFNSVTAMDLSTICEGKVNVALKEDGFLTDNLQNAFLTIDSFNIDSNYNIFVNGFVTYNNQSFPLRISGRLYKSELSDSLLVGNITTNDSDFKVLHLGVSSCAQTNDLLVCPNLNGKEVFYLYLLRDNTNELSLFEIDYNQICNQILNYVDAEQVSDLFDEHWWVNILTPKIEESIQDFEQQLSYYPFNSVNETHREIKTTNYVYTLATDNSYKYHIELTAEFVVHDFGYSSQISDTCTFTITDQYIDHNGSISELSHLIVSDPSVTVELTPTSSDDYISRMDWSMETDYKTGGLNFEFKKLSYDAKFGTLSWTPQKTVKYTNYNWQGGAEDTKGASVNFPYALKKIGDNVNLDIRKERNNSIDSSHRALKCTLNYKICYVNVHTVVTPPQSFSIMGYYRN